MTAAVSLPTTPTEHVTAPTTAPAADEGAAEAKAIADILAERDASESAATTPSADKPKEEPAAEEPAAEPAKEDKLAAAAKTIRRAKEAAKRSREADARAEKERIRAESLSQQLEAERRDTLRAREEREAFKKDPLSAIKQAGVTARQLAQKAIEEGTPEARIAAMEAAFEERLAKARAEVEQKFNETLSARDTAAAQREFFAMVKPDTHPALSRLNDNEAVLFLARRVYDKAQKQGYTPTDAEVLAHVESLLSPQSEVAAHTAKPKTNPGQPTSVQTVAKPAPASRTVTSELAGRSYTLPANFDDLDDYEQRDALSKMAESLGTRIS